MCYKTNWAWTLLNCRLNEIIKLSNQSTVPFKILHHLTNNKVISEIPCKAMLYINLLFPWSVLKIPCISHKNRSFLVLVLSDIPKHTKSFNSTFNRKSYWKIQFYSSALQGSCCFWFVMVSFGPAKYAEQLLSEQ